MRLVKRSPTVACTVAVLLIPFVLASCGGNGGGGGGGGGSPTLLLITAEGASGPVWDSTNGLPPACPDRVFVNGRIIFTFDGPVDPLSLPHNGFASGSINVALYPTGNSPATGSFTVED